MRPLVLSVLFLAAAGCGSTPSTPDAGGASDAGNEDVRGTDGGDINQAAVRFTYRYGNQIYGSQLDLQDRFLLIRTERTCCPPTFTDAGVPELGPAEALELYSWVRVCSGTGTERLPVDGGAAAGDLYGRFELLLADGGTVILRREELEDGGHIIERNTCADLPRLLGFVNDIVDVDMPLSR